MNIDEIRKVINPVERKQSLHANVIRACRHCGAPGFWHNVENVNTGCYDPSRLGQPVGEACPQCGGSRQAVEDHGEVWTLELRALDRIKKSIKDYLKTKWSRSHGNEV